MVATVLSSLNGQPISMEENRAYLNREQSECIKGILIILIVLGHNHILCPNTVSGGMMEYLYTFHVAGFFILPFFYQSETKTSWTKAGNTITRCWVPYFWICLCCWFSYSIVSHHFEFGFHHIVAFFQGTQTPLAKYYGFVFPWFLPTYCSLSLLMLLSKKKKWMYLVLSLMGTCTLFMSWIQFYQFKNSIPFGLGLAIYYFFLGVITFQANKLSAYSKYVGGLLFCVLSVCWWMGISLPVIYHFMPVSFFLLLLCICPHLNCKWIRIWGHYSLGIYLIHIFISNITYQLLPHSYIMGGISFVLCLFVPLVIIMQIYKNNVLRRMLFPKKWGEFHSLFL